MSGRFVHLHVHTEYSLLDGAAKVGKLVKRAVELGMPALAITDHGVMYGAMEFYIKAKEAGIKPILGCEVYVASGSRSEKTAGNQKSHHLVLLAKNNVGYRNLCKLVSIGHLEGFYYKPRVDREVLEKYHEGIIALSACLGGEIPALIMHNQIDKAKETALWYKDLFGDDFYLELQDHSMPEQKLVNSHLIPMAQELGIKLICTNDSHYTLKEDARAQEVLLCLQTGKTLADPKKMHFGPEFYLKSEEEMAALFPKEALDNSLEIAQKCNLILEMGRYRLPFFPVPEGETSETYLNYLVWKGIKERFPELTPAIEERLRYELAMIERMGFSAYFLIVWDFINYAKTHGISVGPGRGSAAGSLVAYALRITNIDPLKYNLLFERFLNPERVSMPDVDVDFCIERRGDVIKYVAERYGADRVSQIGTFGTMGAKMAIKDVGRVLGFLPAETNRLCKLVPDQLHITLDEATADGTELGDEIKKEPRFGELIELAKKLEGMVRNSSIHAAGVLIARDPIDDLVPLQRNGDDGACSQYEQKYVEQLGLLKMDFLGLRNLTMIDKALRHIKKNHGIDIDFDKMTVYEDKKTFDFLQTGHTIGVFQLESDGMRRLVQQLSPSVFEDIAALVALFRPGPLQSGMVESFVNRKHGREAISYPHDDLEWILKDTYGTCIYQEQVMQIAQVFAGYSLGQADLLRRAMGKKKPEEMAKQKHIFLDGASKKGHPPELAESLFDSLAKFAEYGFNRSHSAAYGVVTYYTAFLKANYPAEYMAALLSSVIDTQDKVPFYINECKRMGIPVLPPDVNHSDVDFAVSEGAIRFGLAAIKNVGTNAVEAILKARERLERFQDLFQFCEEVDLRAINKRAIECLIKCGAFDSTGFHRAQLLGVLDEAVDSAMRRQKEAANGQISLFGGVELPADSAPLMARPVIPDAPSLTFEEQLRMEKELLGFYVSGHPLQAVDLRLEWHTTHFTEQLPSLSDNAAVVVGGMLTNTRRGMTKKGLAMLSGMLEDFTGKVEVVFFPEAYEKFAFLLAEDAKLLVKGKFSSRDDQVKVIANQVWALDRLPSLHLDLSPAVTGPQLARVSQIIRNHSGETPVVFHFEGRDEEVVAGAAFWVEPSPSLMKELASVLPEERIRLSDPKPLLALVQ